MGEFSEKPRGTIKTWSRIGKTDFVHFCMFWWHFFTKISLTTFIISNQRLKTSGLWPKLRTFGWYVTCPKLDDWRCTLISWNPPYIVEGAAPMANCLCNWYDIFYERKSASSNSHLKQYSSHRRLTSGHALLVYGAKIAAQKSRSSELLPHPTM